jgi:hypothetical protein
MRSSLSYDVTPRILEVTDVSGQPTGPIFKCQAAQGHSSWTAGSLSMVLRVYTGTSVTNYQSTLRNIPEERKSKLHRTGRLKSRLQNFNCLYIVDTLCILFTKTSIRSALTVSTSRPI